MSPAPAWPYFVTTGRRRTVPSLTTGRLDNEVTFRDHLSTAAHHTRIAQEVRLRKLLDSRIRAQDATRCAHPKQESTNPSGLISVLSAPSFTSRKLLD